MLESTSARHGHWNGNTADLGIFDAHELLVSERKVRPIRLLQCDSLLYMSNS